MCTRSARDLICVPMRFEQCTMEKTRRMKHKHSVKLELSTKVTGMILFVMKTHQVECILLQNFQPVQVDTTHRHRRTNNSHMVPQYFYGRDELQIHPPIVPGVQRHASTVRLWCLAQEGHDSNHGRLRQCIKKRTHLLRD